MRNRGRQRESRRRCYHHWGGVKRRTDGQGLCGKAIICYFVFVAFIVDFIFLVGWHKRRINLVPSSIIQTTFLRVGWKLSNLVFYKCFDMKTFLPNMLLLLMMLLMWIKQYGVLFEKCRIVNIVKGYWSIIIMKSKHRCGTNFSTFLSHATCCAWIMKHHLFIGQLI